MLFRSETEADLRDPSHIALVPWVRARLEGGDPQPPEGGEELVAELYALAGRYDPEGGAVLDEDAAKVALRELVLQVRLRAADDRVGPLRVKLEDGSATPDEQRELADLQRTAEGLRAELRGMNVPGA